jgi:hypothetical protein
MDCIQDFGGVIQDAVGVLRGRMNAVTLSGRAFYISLLIFPVSL